ncbi:MAG: MFS transporter [Micavibrio sp.]|nr:MFS transporter [Micavibrio sp.]
MPVEPATTASSPPHWNAIGALAVGVAGLIIAEFLPAGVLTLMSSDLAISEGTAGQAVTVTSIFAVITSLTIAYLSRNFDRRTVILTLSFLLSASSIIVAYAPNFYFLLLGRILLGISLGGFWSMAVAISMRLVPENMAPRALSIIFGTSAFSAVLAAPLGSYLGNIIGWRNVFLVAALIGFFAFAAQYFTLPALKPLSVTKLSTTWRVLKISEIPLALLAIGFVFCGRFATFTYLRPFLEQTTGASMNAVSAILLIFGLSYFVGNFFSEGMIKKNMHKTLAVPPVILFFVAAGLLAFGHSVWMTAALVFIWGAAFGPVGVCWSTWLAGKVPENRETIGGLYVAAIQLAASVGAYFGGLAFDKTGSSGVFILSGIAWLASGTIVFFGITVAKKPAPEKCDAENTTVALTE